MRNNVENQIEIGISDNSNVLKYLKLISNPSDRLLILFLMWVA